MGFTPPYLEVRKITGGWAAYGPTTTTTEDLTIFPNTTDATPYIKLNGGSSIQVVLPNGSTLYIMETTNARLQISYSTPDVIIESPTDAKNIFLKTTGTGVVKFGTYTAGAATDSTGYITILDAAGNTRKLMVQA